MKPLPVGKLPTPKDIIAFHVNEGWTETRAGHTRRHAGYRLALPNGDVLRVPVPHTGSNASIGKHLWA